MALSLSIYFDPSVVIGEDNSGGVSNIASTPVQIGIVGPGDRTKRISNEAVQRGLVEAEALTLIAPSGSVTSISAPSSGVQTLTDASAAFALSIIGRTVTISGTTSGLNVGTFTILDRPSATTITYTNASGVIQGSAVGTYVVSPYVSLAHRSDRALQNTTAFRNGVVLSDTHVAYQPAFLQGDVTADRNFTSPNNSMVLSMDGKIPITIRFLATAAATSVAQVGGTQFDLTLATAAQPALTPVTIAEVAAGINAVLVTAGATTLGYGTAYASAVRVVTAGLRFTSPLSTPASDVQISAPVVNDLNGAAASRFFATYSSPMRAASVLGISRLVFSSTSTYTVDYINLDSNSDALNNTGVSELIKVGSFAGVGNFEAGTDYLQSVDSISWGGTGTLPDLPPTFPTAGQAGTIVVPANITDGAADALLLSFDGRASLALDVRQAASSVLGFTTGALATAAQIAGNINALVGNSALYGPAYKAVASVVNLGGGNFIQLTSPTEGEAGSVQILVPTANTANLVIFGLSSTQTVSVTGSGSRPALAAIYFATYSIARPAGDYEVQKRFFTLDSLKSDLGPVTADNPLVVAAEIAFLNGAPSVVVVQVDDSSTPGSPTRQEFLDALSATTETDVITDVVMLTTDLASQTDLKDHIESQCSPTEKHWRRGWFGMARSTDVGDKDTADTFVFRARRTLQVAADSPGRGRMILVAPPQLTGVSRDITLEDGSTQTLALDSTYLAVALAAKKSSFLSPATSLAKKTITGFNVSDITSPWLKAERGLLASQGTMVVTFDAGLFKILDPVTTEKGGGGVAKFSFESTSSQKDNLSRKIDQALDANIIGIVPSDLADFIVDIKLLVAGVISGEIGSGSVGNFTTANGSTRAIDASRDIEVQQDPSDPTKFFFQYAFNLRYPALRLVGTFTTDNPLAV